MDKIQSKILIVLSIIGISSFCFLRQARTETAAKDLLAESTQGLWKTLHYADRGLESLSLEIEKINALSEDAQGSKLVKEYRAINGIPLVINNFSMFKDKVKAINPQDDFSVLQARLLLRQKPYCLIQARSRQKETSLQ